jgi:hypothetical protein
MLRRSPLVVLTVLALLASACGPQAPAAAPTAGSGAAPAPAATAAPKPTTAPASTAPAAQAKPGALDPCGVASKQELETAIGVTLANGRLQKSAVDVCIYEEQAGKTVPTTVYVYAMRSSAADSFYEDARKQESQATEVPGLGDKAFRTASGTLTAVQRDVFVSIDVDNGPSGADVRDRIVGLMRTILGRT